MLTLKHNSVSLGIYVSGTAWNFDFSMAKEKYFKKEWPEQGGHEFGQLAWREKQLQHW